MEGFVLVEGDMQVAKLLTMFDAPPQLGGVSMTELMLKDVFSEVLNPKVSGSHANFGPDVRFKSDGTLESPLKIPIIDRDTNKHYQLGEVIVPYDFRTRETTKDKITIEIPKVGENNKIVHGSEASKEGITLRENGTMSDYVLDGQRTPIYKVEVDMFENLNRRNKDDIPEDVWIVKNLKEAEKQLQAMKEGEGGATNFANKIVKTKDGLSGEDIYILKDNKPGRRDHKYIYIKGSNAYKELLKEKHTRVTSDGKQETINALQKDPKGREKGKPYIKGAEVPYNVVLFARRDPYFKEGSLVPIALKDFNEKKNGNQFILNDKDAYHHLETDMDGDTGAISHKYSKLVSQEFIRIATQAEPTKVRPHNGNAAYDTLPSGPYNPMKVISQLEFAEVQTRAAKLRGSIMQIPHIAHWFLNNGSRSNLRVLSEDGMSLEAYEGPLFPIAGGARGPNVYLGIRSEVRKKGGYSRFRQELAKDIQTLVDTAKGNWDTEYYSNARDITNRLLFHKDYGLFVPYGREQLTERGPLKGELALVEKPSIDFMRDHPKAFKAIEKLWMIKKDSLKFRNNELNADGSMRKPKFKDRKETMDRYGEELSGFEWSKEVQAIRDEMGWDSNVQILQGFNSTANFIRDTRGTNYMQMVDRIDKSMHSGINHGWSWKNPKTDITSIVESTIADLTNKRERDQNNQYVSDAEHYNKVIRKFREQVSNVSQEFYLLETLQNKISELKNERRTLTGSDMSGATKITAKIEAYESSKNNAKEGLKDYLDVDAYLDGKVKLKPKVKEFLDEVLKDYRTKEERRLKEKKGDNFSVLDAGAKDKIEKTARSNMRENGLHIEQVSRGDILEAMAAERAYGNVAESTPTLLRVDPKIHSELLFLIDTIKKDYHESMSKEFKPEESSGFINDNYIVDHAKEQLLGVLSADKYQNPALKELVFRRLLSPEIQSNKVGSYRGNLYFMPRYTNFHKFVKLGMQTSWEAYKGNKMELEALWRPFIENYKREVLIMQHGIVGEGTLKDGKMTPENWRAEHLTMGSRYNKLRLLEELVPEAENLFGKRITELDNYTLDSIVFGNGALIPEVINNNRLTNLPHKAITDFSAEYGRDYAIFGKKEADFAKDKLNVRAFVVDKDRNSYIRSLQTNKTLKLNETSQNLTQERSVDMPKDLKEYERNSQKESEIDNESPVCAISTVIKGD